MKKILLTLSALFISLYSFTQEEKRLALVIGNANYEKGELKNPVNDARLIASTLDSLNFDVILKENLATKRDMTAAIREFGSKRSNYDVAFVYYAGHGIQVDDENFLLPTREVFEEEFDVMDYGVSVQNIMRYLKAQTNEVNILILDACRDNPFESNWNTTRSLKGQGLAKIPPPTGSLIAFSTDSGQTAPDGDGENSVYTTSLSKNMLLEDTSIDQVFRNVRSEVLVETGGMQRPVEATQLTGTVFYLKTSDFSDELKFVELILRNEKKNKYQNSILIIERILENQPDNLKAQNLKGELLIGLKNFKNAIEYYKSLNKLNAKNSFYYRMIGYAFSEIGEFENALAEYNKAIEFDPGNMDNLFNRAELYQSKLKNYEKALADYMKIFELDVNMDFAKSFRLNNNVGLLYLNHFKNDEKALKYFNKEIELRPEKGLAYYNRAKLYLNNLNDVKKAFDDINTAIRLESDDDNYYDMRGYLFEKIKDYENALIDYNKGLEINPNNTYLLMNRGNYYENHLHDHQKALADYLMVSNLNPNLDFINLNLGRLYRYRFKDYEKALKYFNKEIKLYPKRATGYSYRANFYYQVLNKNNKALEDFNKAIELEPEDDFNYYWRGNFFLDIGNLKNALADFNTVIKLNPNHIDVIWKKSEVLRLDNQYQNSINFNIEIINKYNELINKNQIYYDDGIDLIVEAMTNLSSIYSEDIIDIKKSIFYANEALKTNSSRNKKVFELESFLLEFRAKIYSKFGKNENALADIFRAIEIDSENRDLYYFLINHYLMLKDYDKAIETIDKTIEMDQNDPDGFYKKSLVYYDQKDYLNSLVSCSNAILKFEEDNGVNYYISDLNNIDTITLDDLYAFRAELFSKLGNKKSACEDYLKVKDLGEGKIDSKIEMFISGNCK